MRRIQRKGGPFSGKMGPFSDKRRGTAQLYWDMLKEECKGINPQLDVTLGSQYPDLESKGEESTIMLSVAKPRPQESNVS